MPNHVKTILTISERGGTTLADIRKAMLNDEGQIDFNVINPMPECLRDFTPNMGVLNRAKMALGLLTIPADPPTGISDLTHRLEISNAMRDATTPAKPDDIPDVIRAIQAHAECGFVYWYDWSVKHWGTKWNAYGQPDEGWSKDATEFTFETAWSHPDEMIQAISEAVPAVLFSVRYADEDTGSNCGRYTVKDGNRSNADIAPGWEAQSEADKRRWVEFAFRLWHGDDADPREHGYDQDWEYSDEVYESSIKCATP